MCPPPMCSFTHLNPTTHPNPSCLLRFMYLLFAAAPYETIAFKIPNQEIDKREGRFVTSWAGGKFTLTLFFTVDGGTALTPASPLLSN